MEDTLPAHAIMSIMLEFAEQAPDAPLERLGIAFANLLEAPVIQALEAVFGQLVLFGAGIWRPTDTFRNGGSHTVQ